VGIDPGSLHTGYGVVELSGPAPRLRAFGRISPAARLPFPERLKVIFEALGELLESWKPRAAALEDVFAYRNPRSAFRLAQARGAAMVALAVASVPVFEYPPSLIKSAVCGSGRAEKGQVAFMVASALGIRGKTPADATDALACALCHAGQAGVRDIRAAAPALAASRARSASWRGLTAEDLVAMGYRVEARE
jgi:crossover junction endodeoxyribonuclease RuvC